MQYFSFDEVLCIDRQIRTCEIWTKKCCQCRKAVYSGWQKWWISFCRVLPCLVCTKHEQKNVKKNLHGAALIQFYKALSLKTRFWKWNPVYVLESRFKNLIAKQFFFNKIPEVILQCKLNCKICSSNFNCAIGEREYSIISWLFPDSDLNLNSILFNGAFNWTKALQLNHSWPFHLNFVRQKSASLRFFFLKLEFSEVQFDWVFWWFNFDFRSFQMWLLIVEPARYGKIQRSRLGPRKQMAPK